jgi:hypothetical protein
MEVGLALPPLLVFGDDWARHPSSCQHLVRQLLPRHAVYWVNTIGTRKPQINLSTLRRAREKVRHWLWPDKLNGDNPQVHNPRMWPSFGSPFARGLNRRLLRRHLVPLIRSLPAEPVAVTTHPLVADLMTDLRVRRWIYYCVDDFSQWPGLDVATMQKMEAELVRRADVLIAVSETLQKQLERTGRSAHLLTHGVDLDFWTSPSQTLPLPQLSDLPKPLVVFWGLLDRRVDVSFLRQLSADLSQGTVVLVGPADNPDPALESLPRVHRLGPVAFEQLPLLAREASVLIMPYADLPVTRAMQPLKLKEYLASGRSTVVSDLPANRSWADCMDLVRTPGEFSQTVRKRIETGLPEDQRRARRRLVQETWAAKAHAFSGWVLDGQLPIREHFPVPRTIGAQV